MSHQIEAVFEKGVFRPLHPVDFLEHERVTLFAPASPVNAIRKAAAPAVPSTAGEGIAARPDEIDEEVPYEPLPLRDCKTIRVTVQFGVAIPLLPYPVDDVEVEVHDEPEKE